VQRLRRAIAALLGPGRPAVRGNTAPKKGG